VKSLREIVAAVTATAEELPLVHTTRCEKFDGVRTSNQIEEPVCDVFGEPIVYLFYGRPAFQPVSGSAPSATLDPCPVCFVFAPQTIGRGVKRVFACDSGGVYREFFTPHLYQADRDEMELDPALTSAQKLVSLMFGDNAKYLLGDAKAAVPPSFSPGSAAARYHALLTTTVQLVGGGDDRRSAIEVQIGSPLPLDHHLRYVVLPNQKLGEPGVLHTIQHVWQAEAIGYDFIRCRPACEYRSLFYELLKPKLQQEGLL